MSSEFFFEIIHYLKQNPDNNASHIAKKLKLHVATVQKILDTMETYGFVTSKRKEGLGRPSKLYYYKGGRFTINLDELLSIFQDGFKVIREAGNPEITFSFDVDKELINAILIRGKNGEKIKLDNKLGKFLWLLPPPDSKGETIESLARNAGVAKLDAILFAGKMMDLNIIEEVKK